MIFNYLILLISAVFILQSKNFPNRYEKLPNNLAKSIGSTYNCSISEYIKFGDTYACLLNSKAVDDKADVLFGNSRAKRFGGQGQISGRKYWVPQTGRAITKTQKINPDLDLDFQF